MHSISGISVIVSWFVRYILFCCIVYIESCTWGTISHTRTQPHKGTDEISGYFLHPSHCWQLFVHFTSTIFSILFSPVFSFGCRCVLWVIVLMQSTVNRPTTFFVDYFLCRCIVVVVFPPFQPNNRVYAVLNSLGERALFALCANTRIRIKQANNIGHQQQKQRSKLILACWLFLHSALSENKKSLQHTNVWLFLSDIVYT